MFNELLNSSLSYYTRINLIIYWILNTSTNKVKISVICFTFYYNDSYVVAIGAGCKVYTNFNRSFLC